jgi:hypothetical protein
MLRDYARLIVFTAALLAGIQVPGFVDQYGKRVSAHYIEAQRSFAGFQATADQYFGGSVPALLAHHEASGDGVFIAEAKTIRSLGERLAALAAESAALTGPLIRQIAHVLFAADREILAETAREFSYTVPLTPSAILCGLSLAFAVALFVEFLLIALFRGFARLLGARSRDDFGPASRVHHHPGRGARR